MGRKQVLRTLFDEVRARILQKEVTVYDSYGYRDPADPSMWLVPMRVWVHDNRDTPFVEEAIERWVIGHFEKDLERPLQADEKAQLLTCLANFIADDKSHELASLAFADDDIRTRFQFKEPTTHNGVIAESIRVPDELVRACYARQAGDSRWLEVEAQTGDAHGSGKGRIRFLEPEGLSVVSDIDDTIRITHVPAGKRAVLRPPKPPTHDSLRLRIVTVLLPFDSADATLAQRVRDGAIAEMEKDPWLFVVTPRAWVEQAPLIGLGEVALMEPDTIRKYARKTRTHVIVDFGVSQVSSGFVITAEARGASTDSSLGVIAAAAASALDLPEAMTRLNRTLRERLVAARASLPPTKWSANTTDQPAQAIEYYVEGRSEASRLNFIEASRRARKAVEVDSTFAQAWRLLHSSLYNARLSVDDQLRAISAAFRFSHLVRGPSWRLDIVSAYYRAMGDHETALVFYDSLARIAPVQNVNAGMSYASLRRYELATRVYRRRVDADGRRSISAPHTELVYSLLVENKVAEARREAAEMVRIDSAHPRTKQGRAYVFAALWQWDSLSALGRSSLSRARSLTDSATGLQWVGRAAIARGHLATFDSMAQLRATIVTKHGSSGDYLAGQLERALVHATLAADTARARAIADSALAVVGWQSLKQMDRPYLAMLLYLASVRDIERGKALAEEWSRRTPAEFKRRDSLNVLIGRGELALASGNAHDALRFFRLADVLDCETCFYPRYARAFDAIDEGDSARVWFERTAAAVNGLHLIGSSLELPHAFRRLGELAEARGDLVSAIKWYEQFVALWATSDIPALQASMRTIRSRLEKLGVAPKGNGIQ